MFDGLGWILWCFQTPFPIPQSSTKPPVWPLLATAARSALRLRTHVPHQLNRTEYWQSPVPLTYITLRELILSLSSHLFGFVRLCYADAAQSFFSMTLNEKAVLAALNAV